jgi:hypothetical protein
MPKVAAHNVSENRAKAGCRARAVCGNFNPYYFVSYRKLGWNIGYRKG